MSKRSRRKKLRMLSTESDNPKDQPKDAVIVNQLQSEQHHDKKKYPKIIEFYDKHYKLLLVIPLLLLLLAILQISVQTATTGDFIKKGVSLKGGVTVTIPTESELDQLMLSSAIKSQFPGLDLGVRVLESAGKRAGYVIEADIHSPEDIERLLSIIEVNTNLPRSLYGLESIQPSLGASFFNEAFRAMIVAFVFMAIVVFITFRSFVPSIAVVFAVFSDMVITVAVVNLLDVKISTAGIAAFLMLIGYSVDTDILLSTRVLKREEGTVLDRIIGSAKTGLTMIASTIVAATITFLFTESETLKQIMLIILIGMLADIINTWVQNAAILRWYVEHKVKKNEQA